MKRNKNGYLVMNGLAGCLLESVVYCETLKQAIYEAQEWKAQVEDMGDRVTGNIRRDWRYEVAGEHSTEYASIQVATAEDVENWLEGSYEA